MINKLYFSDVLIGSRSFADFHTGGGPASCPPNLGDGPLDSGMTRWASKEDLLASAVKNGADVSSSQDGSDPQIFVALYDFLPTGENQMSLEKGTCSPSLFY